MNIKLKTRVSTKKRNTWFNWHDKRLYPSVSVSISLGEKGINIVCSTTLFIRHHIAHSRIKFAKLLLVWFNYISDHDIIYLQPNWIMEFPTISSHFSELKSNTILTILFKSIRIPLNVQTHFLVLLPSQILLGNIQFFEFIPSELIRSKFSIRIYYINFTRCLYSSLFMVILFNLEIFCFLRIMRRNQNQSYRICVKNFRNRKL